MTLSGAKGDGVGGHEVMAIKKFAVYHTQSCRQAQDKHTSFINHNHLS